MWERIESDGDGPKMRRMAVPGGWLYAEYYNTQVYPVFVPQPAEQGDKVKPSDLAPLLSKAAETIETRLQFVDDKEAAQLVQDLLNARKVER